jgi:hypothetical protein
MSESPNGILVPLPSAQLPVTTATPLEATQEPTLDQMANAIRCAHGDVANAIASAVERGLTAGLWLTKAKVKVPKGTFESFVAHCGLQLRTAQSYMQLARRETEVRQLLADKAHGIAPLRMHQALAYVRKLDAKGKPKRRKRAKLFGLI